MQISCAQLGALLCIVTARSLLFPSLLFLTPSLSSLSLSYPPSLTLPPYSSLLPSPPSLLPPPPTSLPPSLTLQFSEADTHRAKRFTLPIFGNLGRASSTSQVHTSSHTRTLGLTPGSLTDLTSSPTHSPPHKVSYMPNATRKQRRESLVRGGVCVYVCVCACV